VGVLGAALGALVASAGLAAPARAGVDGPLGCQGVVAVDGGYRLTADTTCGFTWSEDHVFLDLAGHTMTATIVADGQGQVIRNGTLRTGDLYLAGSRDDALVDLQVQNVGNFSGFAIEAGSGLTVERSSFSGFPGIALDFYFGNGGTVTDSVFTGNQVALSVQGVSGVRVSGNRFVGNDVGVNLWNEDSPNVGVRVDHNTFVGNAVAALNVRGDLGNSEDGRAYDAVTIEHNVALANPGVGLNVAVSCWDESTCAATSDLVGSLTVRRNSLSRGGQDGMRATAAMGDGTNQVDAPWLLAGVVVGSNRADRNEALGFDVVGVTDAGGNLARRNGDERECLGVDCTAGGHRASSAGPWARAVSAGVHQLRHRSR
jgi:hypothetical protein